jgi:hypothetical protein
VDLAHKAIKDPPVQALRVELAHKATQEITDLKDKKER